MEEGRRERRENNKYFPNSGDGGQATLGDSTAQGEPGYMPPVCLWALWGDPFPKAPCGKKEKSDKGVTLVTPVQQLTEVSVDSGKFGDSGGPWVR